MGGPTAAFKLTALTERSCLKIAELKNLPGMTFAGSYALLLCYMWKLRGATTVSAIQVHQIFPR